LNYETTSLGNNILCLAPFPEIEEKPEIFINLTNSFEFNTPKGTDSQGNKYIVEYWINPQARIGELVQLRMNKFQPIGKEEIITTRIGNYRRMCMVIHLEKEIRSWKITGLLCYDKRTGILLERFQQRYAKDGSSVAVHENANSTNIPELLGDTTLEKCKICGRVVPENFKFCGNCGSPVDERKCPQCGEAVPENFKFCGNCGTQINDNQTRIY
jgi:RNA polymerase subunit RPABC4/transcription elongation factor Spt4